MIMDVKKCIIGCLGVAMAALVIFAVAFIGSVVFAFLGNW